MVYQAESKERKISDGTEEIPVYRTTPEKVAIHVAKTGNSSSSLLLLLGGIIVSVVVVVVCSLY